jgi:tryptophanyl-tRNA synthetase
MGKKRIVSGMRPTGRIHLGHIHGAITNWVKLQDEYDCFYFIADWHALTSNYAETQDLKTYILEIIVDWIASGLDPEKVTFFIQSSIKEHAELHLLFSMITPLPWLERNPTYKEQLKEMGQKDLYTYGFLGYPVLQAADILIYKAYGVPVGEDQAPHVEMTREIARRFNHIYKEVFPIPELILAPKSKILGIDRRKMSKSYNNAIFISDSPGEITEKVSQMITDPQRKRRNDPGDPAICNVFSFHEIYTDEQTLHQIESDCKSAGIGCVECKKIMAKNLNTALNPVREKREDLLSHLSRVKEIVEDGNTRARAVAQATMDEVRDAVRI